MSKADSLREALTLEKVRKAQAQTSKVREVEFIVELETQNTRWVLLLLSALTFCFL